MDSNDNDYSTLIKIYVLDGDEEIYAQKIKPVKHLPRIGEMIRLKFGRLPQEYYKKMGVVTNVSYGFLDETMQEINITVQVVK